VFVLEGVSLWVINEVSNSNKQLRTIDEKNQYNMRAAEETASLALLVISAVFSSTKLTWIRKVVIGNNTESIRLLKL